VKNNETYVFLFDYVLHKEEKEKLVWDHSVRHITRQTNTKQK